jgi:hypothetical protein
LAIHENANAKFNVLIMIIALPNPAAGGKERGVETPIAIEGGEPACPADRGVLARGL